MSQIERIKQAIIEDPQNASYTEQGIEPLFAAPKTARINIIGQAPGLKTQEAGLYWKDKSGDRLREWLGRLGLKKLVEIPVLKSLAND